MSCHKIVVVILTKVIWETVHKNTKYSIVSSNDFITAFSLLRLPQKASLVYKAGLLTADYPPSSFYLVHVSGSLSPFCIYIFSCSFELIQVLA